MKSIFLFVFNTTIGFIIPFIPLYIGGWNFERNIAAQNASVFGIILAFGAAALTILWNCIPKIQ